LISPERLEKVNHQRIERSIVQDVIEFMRVMVVAGFASTRHTRASSTMSTEISGS